MVKLSTPLAFVRDPSSVLLSLKYGPGNRSLPPDPQWFAKAMLKLYRPPNLIAQRFPIPVEMQRSVLAHDVSSVMDRLKALSVSRCQRTVINITPRLYVENLQWN